MNSSPINRFRWHGPEHSKVPAHVLVVTGFDIMYCYVNIIDGGEIVRGEKKGYRIFFPP